MNILFTLCGRAGSKGVKGKNTRNFCGKPLVWYSLATMQGYKEKYSSQEDIIHLALNTDSELLVQQVKERTRIPLLSVPRDVTLAGDRAPKVSVIKDCLLKAEKNYNLSYDVVVDLDITSPLRTIEDVRNAIEEKINRPDVDVVYSVTDSRRNPYFNMVREENGYFKKAIASEFTTRQEAPVFYDMNASIYAYSPNALKNKEANIFFNDRCGAIKMFDTGVLDIDSEEDYELMQVIAKNISLFNDNFSYLFNLSE